MPIVSIVLPCYNHGEFVEDAIRSVLNQTYSDFELFVFDNGSTDDSWEHINRFDDVRIKKIQLKKNDLLEVKKIFIEKSVGKYCAIMHADDIWLPEKLARQVELLESNREARVCFTWSRFVDENLNEIPEKEGFFKEYNKSQKEWWHTFYEHDNHLSCPSFICEKDIYIKYFGRLYPYRQIADYYCWMKILCETNLYIVEDYLVKQRVHESGENRNESARTVRNISRENVELCNIKYKIITEMPDDVFMNNFVKDSINKDNYTHMDVLCEKMLYFISRGKEKVIYFDNAVRFYIDNFEYEENGEQFYEYLYENYGFSRNDFFDYEVNANQSLTILGSRLKRWSQLANTDFKTIAYPRSVSIYGCGQIGKILAKKIRDYCTVQQFIDKKPKLASYENIPISALQDVDFDQVGTIIVTPSYDFENIMDDISRCCKSKLEIIKIEDFLSTGSLIDENF